MNLILSLIMQVLGDATWAADDVRKALTERGYSDCKKNIIFVVENCNKINDSMIEAGWTHIECVIDDNAKNLVKAKKKWKTTLWVSEETIFNAVARQSMWLWQCSWCEDVCVWCEIKNRYKWLVWVGHPFMPHEPSAKALFPFRLAMRTSNRRGHRNF